MKILAIHNFHRKGSASGDDQVFKSETALLESHGNQVIKYTVSNDEFDNAGLIGKLSATFGMCDASEIDLIKKILWKSKYKMLCINDSDKIDESSFKENKKLINGELNKLLPQKSSFEI